MTNDTRKPRDKCIICNLSLGEYDHGCLNCSQKLVEALRKERDEYRSGLELIHANKNMTNLGDCCVQRSCQVVYDDGKKVAHCAFQYGVARGFNDGAHIAETILAKYPKESK